MFIFLSVFCSTINSIIVVFTRKINHVIIKYLNLFCKHNLFYICWCVLSFTLHYLLTIYCSEWLSFCYDNDLDYFNMYALFALPMLSI